jgi:PD-(D/E)XK endonuclease
MNTNIQGQLGEVKFITALTVAGWKVSIPLGHDAAYDLVGDFNGKLHRIQVKTSTSSNEMVLVKLQRTYTSGSRIVTKTYALTDFELLGVYDVRTDSCYLVPMEHVAEKGTLSLRFTACRNNQTKRILMAGDFLLESYK